MRCCLFLVSMSTGQVWFVVLVPYCLEWEKSLDDAKSKVLCEHLVSIFGYTLLIWLSLATCVLITEVASF